MSGTESAPQFLLLGEVVVLHELLVRTYGGEPGVRDRGLLESALAQASASYGGMLLHALPARNGSRLWISSREESPILRR